MLMPHARCAPPTTGTFICSAQVRALYNLCTTVENTNQARSLHAASVVEDILESHAEDGQLVFRTNNLLAVLREGEDEDDANAQPIA